MQKMIQSIWRIREKISVRVVDTNLFVFQFYNVADKQRVLEGCPWSFDNQLLLLKKVSGDQQPSEVSFQFSPFWVRLLDVPFGKRTENMAREIGEVLGGFLELDNTDPLGWQEFMRIRVMVDLNKPLRREVKIGGLGNAVKWVDIKYERLTDFCYYCGRIGHVDRDCSYQQNDVGFDEVVYQYGPWLRASPRRQRRLHAKTCEKERGWLEDIAHGKVGLSRGYNDPKSIKLGPPSMVRRALFVSPTSLEVTEAPEQREEVAELSRPGRMDIIQESERMDLQTNHNLMSTAQAEILKGEGCKENSSVIHESEERSRMNEYDGPEQGNNKLAVAPLDGKLKCQENMEGTDANISLMPPEGRQVTHVNAEKEREVVTVQISPTSL